MATRNKEARPLLKGYGSSDDGRVDTGAAKKHQEHNGNHSQFGCPANIDGAQFWRPLTDVV